MPDAYVPRFFSREGHALPGEKRIVTVANPAAAAELAVTVPGGRQWRIQAGRLQLVASATVANRFPVLTLSDGTTVFWQASLSAAITAGQTVQLSFSPQQGQGGPAPGTGVQGLSIPDLYLPPGTVLATVTAGLSAGDQYSGLALLVEELWLDDQELSKLHEQELAAAGIEQTPWGPRAQGA